MGCLCTCGCMCGHVCGMHVCSVYISVCIFEIQVWFCLFFLYSKYALPWGFSFSSFSFQKRTLDACSTSLLGLGDYCSLVPSRAVVPSLSLRDLTLFNSEDRGFCGFWVTGFCGLSLAGLGENNVTLMQPPLWWLYRAMWPLKDWKVDENERRGYLTHDIGTAGYPFGKIFNWLFTSFFIPKYIPNGSKTLT